MLSGRTTTTMSPFPKPSSLTPLTMAAIALPLLPPTRRPSSAMSLLAYAKDSRSSVLYHTSIAPRSSTSGMKSYPIPSTLYASFACSWFNDSGKARIEPNGSAAMTLMFGLCFFSPLDKPVIVPPVPAPATIALICPEVCFQISSAVPCSCARGLSLLAY